MTKVRACVCHFFVAAVGNKLAEGRNVPGRDVTVATPPQQPDTTGPTTAWTMGTTARMDTYAESPEIGGLLREEGRGTAALPGECGAPETDGMGKTLMEAERQRRGNWRWRKTPV